MNTSLDDLWCPDCGKSQSCVCHKHGALHKVQDAAIPSRARLTLPPSLSLKSVKEGGKITNGVFSKRIIPVRSQFGPLDAPVISRTRMESKPTKETTVWKKKHAMRKVQELATTDTMQPLEGDSSQQTITEAVSVSSGQKQDDLQDVIADVTADHQQQHQQQQQSTLSLATQMINSVNHPADNSIESIHPSNIQAMQQLQSESLHIQTSNSLPQLQLQPGMQEFPPLSFPSPTSGMQIQVTAENLQTLQQQFQHYNNQQEMQSQSGLAALAGLNQSQGSFEGMVLPTVVTCIGQLTTEGDELTAVQQPEPSAEVESQSTEDSGVADTSQTTNLSDSTLVDVPSDTDLDESTDQDLNFEIKIVMDDGYHELLDTADEDHSNWMIFVKPAQTVAEQNLIAYQEDGHIFYVSLKPIPTNTELKVWYSPEYGKLLGKSTLPEEHTALVIDGEDHSCSQCTVTFPTFNDLESHTCPFAMKLRKVSGRRKGRPRKYVKPTKTWRAKLEKSRLKSESLSTGIKPDGALPPRRGRPRTRHIVIKPEKTLETKKEEMLKIQRSKKKRGPKTQRDPLSCPHCNSTFVAEAAFHVHVYSHTGVRPFVCDVSSCAKGFMSKFKLERHRLIHSCPRNHKCAYCDKCFNRKDHLKNHLITHDPNKRIWKCETCGKEYSYNFSYRTHMAFHAAEQGLTLECQICKKTHQSKDELLFHLKVHTGARAAKNSTEKTHQCFECGKKFFTRKDVKRHMITHTKKKDFLCQHCPQRFGRKDHLTRHLRTSHSGDNQQTNRQNRSSGENTSTPKRRERTVVLEPTMVPLPIVQVEEEQQIIPPNVTTIGSQAATNLLQSLQYAVTNSVQGQSPREIQIPAAMYEAAAAAAAGAQQPMTISIANLQPPNNMQAVYSNAQTHYTLTDKSFLMNAPQQAQTIVRQVEQPVEYRGPVHNIQANMYINAAQPQQHQTMLAIPKEQQTVDINRTNGILQAEYIHTGAAIPRAVVAGASDSNNRPSVLCGTQATAAPAQVTMTADPRQNQSQTFSTLLGYMETLRFLENLPTTNQTATIPLQQLQNVNVELSQSPQQAHLIPVSAYSAASVNQNIVQNQAELNKSIQALSHAQIATIQNQNDLKNMVALAQGSQTITYQQQQQQPQA